MHMCFEPSNITICPKAATAEAGGAADVPGEGAGLTEDVVARLQDTATVLTQERKRRGRTIPEGLTPSEQIRSFNTLASHPVSCSDLPLFHCKNYFLTF